MILSPISPENYDGNNGPRHFHEHNYEAGLEVVAQETREKSDLDPVVVLDSPDSYIDHGRWEQAPQVIDTTPPQAMGDAALEPNGAISSGVAARRGPDAAVAESDPTGEGGKQQAKSWCGLSSRMLLLVVILVLLLVGAAIGGAVGGTQAKKNSTAEQSNGQTSPPPTSPPSTSPPSTSPTSTLQTSSSSPSATPLPHMNFALQTYELYNYSGRSQLFTEPGRYRVGFPILSYTWIPAKSGDQVRDEPVLACSVAFCNNTFENGWWGSSSFSQEGNPTSAHDTNLLHIACDKQWLTPGCDVFAASASASASTLPVMESPGYPSRTLETESPSSTRSTSQSESEARTADMTSGGSSARVTTAPRTSARSESSSSSSSGSRRQTE